MKRLLILLVIIMLPCIGNSVYAQRLRGQERIDSLLKELPRQKEDTNKANLLNALARGHNNSKAEECIKYANELLVLSEKLQWKKGLAQGNDILGSKYDDIGNYTKSLEYYAIALKLYKELGDKRHEAGTYSNMGTIYDNQSNRKKALEYYIIGLKLAEENGDIDFAATITNNIGNVYQALHDFEQSRKYYFKAIEFCLDVNNQQSLAIAFYNVGGAYDAQDSNDKALEYYLKALEKAREIDSKWIEGATIASIGTVYTKKKNYTIAIGYLQKGLKISEEIGDKQNVGGVLNDIGELHMNIYNGNPVDPAENDNSTELQHGAYMPDGTIPTGKNALLAAAIRYFERALETGKDISSYEVMRRSYANLAEVYKLRGEYRKALEASDHYHAIKDSIFSQANREELLKISMQNEYDRQRFADSLKAAEQQKIASINLKKQKNYTYIGFAGILLLAGFSFFIIKERGKSEKARKQSDELLLNILPEEVASELKTTGGTIAKHFDNVTVMFTDFVNFTQAGEKMTAQNLIDELHSCFKAFDEITSKYGIEKIKTIGDAYLAVAGLPTADPKHANNIVKAAMEITAFMQDRESKLGNRTFQIRIGIHSGSVVAGIVGVKKFAYDIWGDTVNTAARMEQNSEAGKINISQTTYELVQDKFTCSYRGELEAKNKGMLKMYFVEV